MDALVRGPRNPTRQLNVTALFEARGYTTCRADMDYLDSRLKDLDYIALIDVNRYRQFTAVPDLTPTAAAFYQRLVAGDTAVAVAVVQARQRVVAVAQRVAVSGNEAGSRFAAEVARRLGHGEVF